MEQLIDAGAQLNSPEARSGKRPLHAALKLNDTSIVGLLLRAGADPGARTVQGATALELALADKSTAMTLALLQHAGDTGNEVALKALVGGEGGLANLIDLANVSGQESVRKALENIQADIFSMNNSGSRATELAAMLDL